MKRRILVTLMTVGLAVLITASACKSEQADPNEQPQQEERADESESRDKSAGERTEPAADEGSKAAPGPNPAEGPGPNPAEGWERVTVASLDDAQKAKVERAKQAQKTFGKALIGTLTEAIGEGGYAAGISVCHVEAPEIGEKVSKAEDLAIGRTSFRLRNPKNTPPRWAEVYVEERVDEQVIVQGPDETIGYLAPIKMAELCTNCHGPAESLSKEVQLALAETYPEDEATGFEEGDLRGWFWVRVD